VNDFLDLSDQARITVHDLPELIFGSRVRILVVVDTNISITASNGFGVARVVRLLRETAVGCTRFRVDIASRSGGGFVDNGTVGPEQARYQGFRFDSQADGSPVINRYDELFLFGFKPGNDAGPDSNIENGANAFPATDGELAVLTTWMNDGGGVFATGDHDYLGASMCYRIPRVGTMRRWTNAQGVPPIDGVTRLDTNQPVTAGQLAGTASIPNNVESDAKPQPLEWVPERSYRVGLIRYTQPHPLLCHPALGPIDVMPDHPHEGYCIEQADIDGTRTLPFAGGADEYPPDGSGDRHLPRVVGYGRVVPDPPFIHQKGDVDPQAIPMISAYDGHATGVGRVVTDSTWHHWFDMNISGLEAAADPANWDKVSRYFVNVARWLDRPGRIRRVCWWDVLVSHYRYPGIEEYGLKDRASLGAALRGHLVAIHGACTVSEWVVDFLCRSHPSLCKLVEVELFPKFPVRPEPCLSCPPFELIENVVLGGFVEGTRKLAGRLRDQIDAGKLDGVRLEVAEIEKAAEAGARRALLELSKDIAGSAAKVGRVFEQVAQERPAD
jgi:hypothetical protein